MVHHKAKIIEQSKTNSILDWYHCRLLHLDQHKLFPKLHFPFSFFRPWHVHVRCVEKSHGVMDCLKNNSRNELFPELKSDGAAACVFFLVRALHAKRRGSIVQKGMTIKRFRVARPDYFQWGGQCLEDLFRL